jgi:hypothetical protein
MPVTRTQLKVSSVREDTKVNNQNYGCREKQQLTQHMLKIHIPK